MAPTPQPKPRHYVIVQFVVEDSASPSEARKHITDILAGDGWSTAALDVLYAAATPGHVTEASLGGSA